MIINLPYSKVILRTVRDGLRKASLLFAAILIFPLSALGADTLVEKIRADYPRENYIVGVGEVEKSGNSIMDKRVADVMARREIALQIRVRLREESVDIMCEKSSSRVTGNQEDCRNLVVMVVESSVDEFLEGSRIVERGNREGRAYSVAVMPRAGVVKELKSNIEESVEKTKDSIKKAKEGDREAAEKAREEYLKARVYDREREIMEGVRSRSSSLFEELEREIEKLR